MLIGCNPKSLQQMLLLIHMRRCGALDRPCLDSVGHPLIPRARTLVSRIKVRRVIGGGFISLVP